MRRTGEVGALTIFGLAFAVVAASAQSAPVPREPLFSVEAAAGLQTHYTGHAQSVAFGIAPTRSFTVLVTAHRSHTEDEIEFYPDGYASERGNTEQFVALEFRYAFLARKRASPYVLIGSGRGTSRPNVSDLFPDKRQREIGVVFYGGGVRFPIRWWLDGFVDGRLIMAAEGRSDYFGVQLPVRAGVAWRF